MPGDDWQLSQFLPFFHEAITKPVDSQNQEIGYLPTQAFSMALRDFAKENNIDGMVYKSALTGQYNVCLFYDNASSASILILHDVF